MAVLEEYSYKDFSNQSLLKAGQLTGEIVGSCFQQDAPNTAVFPPDARVRFERCNLLNCTIPAGCTIAPSSPNLQFAAQNDGADWVLDCEGKPQRPLDEEAFDLHGLSKDPKDIPDTPLAVSVLTRAEQLAAKVRRRQRLVAEIEALDTKLSLE